MLQVVLFVVAKEERLKQSQGVGGRLFRRSAPRNDRFFSFSIDIKRQVGKGENLS